MKKTFLILLLFCFFSYGQVATGSNATIYVPTTTVTAASQGIVYDDLSFDNAPILLSILRSIDSGTFDGVIFESGRTVNFETVVSIDYTFQNMSENSISNGILTTDGSSLVTFFTDNDICQILTNVPGTGFQNFTFQNIKWEHGGTTITNCGNDNNRASLIIINHSDDGGTFNVYYDNNEFTATPGLYIDGASGFSQAIGGIRDVTFKDCYFHELGRMLFEFFGQRYSDMPNYVPANHAYINNLSIEGGIYEDGGTVDHLGISIVQTTYNVVIKDITIRNAPAMLEVGVTRCLLQNITAEGTGDFLWLGGIYDNYDFPIYIQGDYVIDNVNVNVSGGLDFFGGARDVLIQNSKIETNQSWWSRNTYGTFEVRNSTLKLGYNTQAMFRQELDISDWVFNNVEIEKKTNNNIFQNKSVVSMNCTNILLSGSETFSSAGYQSINDTSTFLDGNFVQEFGDTGTDCGIIGYAASPTPTPPTSNIIPKIIQLMYTF